MRRLVPWALATLSGLLYSAGFIAFEHWYLAWFCLLPLLFVLDQAGSWKRALALSWTTGFVAHLVGFHWTVHLLREFAALPLPLAILGYLLLCLGQSASFGAFGLLAWFLARRGRIPLGIGVVLAIMAVELLFPLIFQSYMANSQARNPWVTQIADLGGVILISGLLALVNGALFEAARALRLGRPQRHGLSIAAALALILSVAYSAVRIAQSDAADAAAPKLRTAIVQANVGAGDKHEDIRAGIRRYKRMTDEAMGIPGVGLVVWPESGFNRAVTPRLSNLEGEVATEVKTPMIIGALRSNGMRDKERKVWNSALALAPGGDIVAAYDKTVLLAFGEYVPGDRFFPWIYDFLPYTSHFQRGATVEPLPVGDYSLSTDICYEDILPAFIRKLMIPIDADGTRPHAMVNVTNDSWYGPVEPHIHLALATFRSIEHRRWLIRSTATGISAFVDSSGRIVEQSGFETEEILVQDVPMREGGATVYGLFGDWAGWGAAIISAGLLARPWWSRRREEAATSEERRVGAA